MSRRLLHQRAQRQTGGTQAMSDWRIDRGIRPRGLRPERQPAKGKPSVRRQGQRGVR